MAESTPKAEPVPEIPDKLYFRIGEVSRLLGVPAYVLRYWEMEFPALAPKKSGSGQRMYRRKEVELLLEIKRLLYERRFTIEGARRLLAPRVRGRRTGPQREPEQSALFPARPAALDNVRKELAALLELLKQHG
ncbi:MAG: MerR family transcriptional regulator [Acidobacteriota bacterium]